MAKKELFETELQKTAAVFKALGHPARLAILQLIADSKSCITGDISDHLPISRTTVNQHLKELKDLQLIKGEVEGVKVNYCLNTENLIRAKMQLDKFFVTVRCC